MEKQDLFIVGVGVDFYNTPSEAGKTDYYKITSIDDFHVHADEYKYIPNGTDIKTTRKVKHTKISFFLNVYDGHINQYERGDL